MKFCLSPIAVAVLALHALPAVAQEASEAPAAAPATSEEPSKADATQLRAVTVQADLPSDYKVDAVSSPKFTQPLREDRKSVVEGKSVSVRVDLGGGRIIKKKKKENKKIT